ncbi:MAG TPA: class I SAM-dependent methyltransferase [Candidatus Eisenbacteria bacterium]|jgi:SAM-dependent methyltransferase
MRLDDSPLQQGATAGGATAAPSPYDAPELYDLLFDSLDFDRAFWLRVGREAGGPVLDLACGTGRVLVPLLEAGVDGDGVDLHAGMLERLRAKAQAKGFHPNIVAADMRDFTMPRRYARVLCAFNAFAHCETIEDQLATLRCCREHLEPGGALVLHMSYPGVSLWLGKDGEPVLELETSRPGSQNRLQLYDTRFKDPVNQSQRSEIEVREVDLAGGVVASHRSQTRQRWVYLYEMELLLRTAGFQRWEIHGGFAGEPLERDDQQMIAWAWKEPA